MPVSSLDALPEAFVSETALSSAISRGVRQGKLRKLSSRLYTCRCLQSSAPVLAIEHIFCSH